MTERWVLVSGGGHAEVPLIRQVKSLGYRVVSTGKQLNGLGHRLSDEFRLVDYSDVGELQKVAEEFNIEGIIPACNDFAALSAASLSEKLGLNGHDPLNVVLTLHHKHLSAKLFDRLGVPHPEYVLVHEHDISYSKISRLGFPVIVKPVDLTGGKGVSICRAKQDVSSAIDRALTQSREKVVIVQQFLEGSHHGVTALLENRKVYFHFADDEQYGSNKFLVAGTTSPSSLTPSHLKALVDSIEKIAVELNLVDGLMHLQVIIHDDFPYVIEICRRCPGDLYPYFVELSTSFSYLEHLVSAQLGISLQGVRHWPVTNTNNIARFCLMAQRSGVVNDIVINPDLQIRASETLLWWSPGDVVVDPMTQKFGIVFVEFSDKSALEEYKEVFPDHYRVVLSD